MEGVCRGFEGRWKGCVGGLREGGGVWEGFE